jgi:hypothetical protein
MRRLLVLAMLAAATLEAQERRWPRLEHYEVMACRPTTR